jgi:hypothetical protein
MSARVALLTALILAIVAPAAHAGSSTVFATGFEEARGMTTDDAGNVYVADLHAITKIAPDGRLLTTYPSAPGALDVAVDGDGFVYASELQGANNARVRKIAANGQTLWSSEAFPAGSGVSVANGRVYATIAHSVVMFDAATGTTLGTAADLTRPGDTQWVTDADAAGQNVYVINNGRVHVLDPTGNERSVAKVAQSAFAQLDVGRDGITRVAYFDGAVEMFGADFGFLGANNQPKSRGIAEFGDWVYTSSGGTRVLRIAKSEEVGGTGPVDTPDPGTGVGSVSINHGATYTNDTHVTLTVSPPRGALTMQVADDGGFQPSTAFSSFGDVRWTLPRSGAERLPKTVYVRFLPSGQTLQDDIILDETAPILTRASASRSGHRYVLRVKATDRTSGLGAVQIVPRHGARRTLSYRAKRRLTLPKGKVSVRVRDRAGNWSHAKRVK